MAKITPRTNRPIVDRPTLIFVGVAVVSAAAVWFFKSAADAQRSVFGALTLFVTIAPMIVIGLFLGGLVKEIANPEKVAPVLGSRSGFRGLALATVIGALTPGGPFAAFPIVYAIFAAGADVGAVVAFLTGWSLIALHRVVIWELPLLGPDFVVLRVIVSLPLAILAGAFARQLSANFKALRVTPPGGEPAGLDGSAKAGSIADAADKRGRSD